MGNTLLYEIVGIPDRIAYLSNFFQYKPISHKPKFVVKEDQGADFCGAQCLLLGASNIENMKLSVKRSASQSAITYATKPGATIEELFEGLQRILQDPHFSQDTASKFTAPRKLLIVLFSTLNDLGAVLDKHYLTDQLQSFESLINQFSDATGRVVRFSVTPYLHAPNKKQHHEQLDDYNRIIVNANTTIFKTATYDPNVQLVRPAKAGRPGNANFMDESDTIRHFHSEAENWMPSAGYHISELKLKDIADDLRVFFSSELSIPNGRPWDAFDMGIEIDDEPIPMRQDGDPEFTIISNYAMAALGARPKEINSRQQQQPPIVTLGSPRDNRKQNTTSRQRAANTMSLADFQNRDETLTGIQRISNRSPPSKRHKTNLAQVEARRQQAQDNAKKQAKARLKVRVDNDGWNTVKRIAKISPRPSTSSQAQDADQDDMRQDAMFDNPHNMSPSP